MNYHSSNGHYIVRIDKDEEIFTALMEFAKKENLKCGHVSGIGALKEVELGCYDLKTQTYDRMKVDEVVELLSLDGNLSINNGEPFFHLHTVISGHDYKCMGGHLFSAKVGVTCEINFRPLDIDVERRPNEEVGLSLLHFCGIED